MYWWIAYDKYLYDIYTFIYIHTYIYITESLLHEYLDHLKFHICDLYLHYIIAY